IVDGAVERLRPGGGLFLEIGDGQGAAVRGLLEARGLADVDVGRDLGGRDRFAFGRRGPDAPG
ncbi:MAG: peptide chain release factor N(5)-glutamine methyltransferase, partial [Gemmatimonadota bacterium]